jgi:2-alkenal reductase
LVNISTFFKGLICSNARFLLAAMGALMLVLAACGDGGAPAPLSSNGGAANQGQIATNDGKTTGLPAVYSETSSEDGSKALPAASSRSPQIPDVDTVLAAQETVMTRIYETVLPSVVHIRVTQRIDQSEEPENMPRQPNTPREFEGFPRAPRIPDEFFRRGEGSGFVWDDQGHIVTNHHVIEGADRVVVTFADDTEVEAKVLGTDPDSDLAVLELVDFEGPTKPVALGDSESLRVGHITVAIGNPFGQEFTMTTGIVSALGRIIRSGNSPFSIPQVVQTDAPINPGNSGGPLLDRRGRVIGVNTQIISRSGSNSGIGFAVPVNTAKRVIPVLISEGSYDYAWLGITGVTLGPQEAEEMGLPPETNGAMVIEVANDSPADQAGLRASDSSLEIEGRTVPLGGDVIVAIEGSEVKDMDDLIVYLTTQSRPGDQVTLEVLRDQGERLDLQVTLGERPGSIQ